MVCETFAAKIEETRAIPATAPYSGAVYDLTELKMHSHRTARLDKGGGLLQSDRGVQRFLQAGQRLLAVIEHNRGGTNKDLARFTSQILNLCERWDR